MPRGLRFLLVPAALLLASGLAAVAQTAPAPRIQESKLDEAERIRKRQEWFFSTRRAGTASAEEMAALRSAAVLETRRALLAQRARRSFGTEAEQNFWVAKGPSPSTVGGWTFGTVSGLVSSLAKDPVARRHFPCGREWSPGASHGANARGCGRPRALAVQHVQGRVSRPHDSRCLRHLRARRDRQGRDDEKGGTSELADFSFDYHDLLFRPVPKPAGRQ